MREIIILALNLLGGLLLMNLPVPKLSLWAQTKELSKRIEAVGERKGKKTETANEFVTRINGKTRESFAGKSFREARNVFETIGQAERYQRQLVVSLLCGMTGFLGGLLLKNLPLAAVLAVGLYFLPLWLSRFSLFRYQRFISDELEISLSLITTSYLRSNDILAAVEENLKSIREPVRGVFTLFCNSLKYVDANAPAQIERMKEQLDNKIFREWCDILILCQDNHLLQAALLPVVNKFAALKQQKEANETRMMQPLRYAAMMTAVVVGFCPLLFMLNRSWFEHLMYSGAGQAVLAGTAIAVFVTINKAVSLSSPISYDV